MNIDLVVFDIAGTTVTDKGNINKCFRKAFLHAGINVKPGDVDKVMGYKKMEAIKIIADKYLPQKEINSKVLNAIHDDFTKQMVIFYESEPCIKPLPFAQAIFNKLQKRNIRVALNTGFTRIITDAVLKRLGWDACTFIDTIVCSDEVSEGRPYPFMIKKIMKQLNISNPKKVAKVGDTKADIEEGRNAGCGLVVAITTGSYKKKQLQKFHPDYIIDSLQQLPALIK